MSKGKLRNALFLAAFAAAGILGGIGAGAMKAQAADSDATTQGVPCYSCYYLYRQCLANGTPKATCYQQYQYCMASCN